MPYGFTLEIGDDGQVIYDEDRKSHTLVSNVDALKQDMKHRFLTIFGEDAIHPTTGLPLLEFFEDEFDENLVESRLEEQALADPRIESVDRVTFNGPDANRQLSIAVEATAVDGETFTVSLLAMVR